MVSPFTPRSGQGGRLVSTRSRHLSNRTTLERTSAFSDGQAPENDRHGRRKPGVSWERTARFWVSNGNKQTFPMRPDGACQKAYRDRTDLNFPQSSHPVRFRPLFDWMMRGSGAEQNIIEIHRNILGEDYGVWQKWP